MQTNIPIRLQIHQEGRVHRIQVRTLFDGGVKQNEIKETLLTAVCQKCCQQNQKRIQDIAKNYSTQFRRRWLAVNRTKHVFFSKNENWLKKFLFLNCISGKHPDGVGRPKLEFEQLTYSGKFRRTENLRKSDSNELLFAVQMNLKANGKKTTAKSIRNLVQKNNIPNEPDGSKSQLSSERALALTVDARLSKRQYQELRNIAKENNSNLYPPYNQIREAKKLCYPNDITATDHSVSVKLQSLLDHTTCRLLSTLELDGFKSLKKCELIMISKWGMDGSSGQKEYRQAFESNYSDKNLLLTCLVPLQIYTWNKKNEKILIWNNPMPSSTRYCRPCKIQFLKENIEVSKSEYAVMQAEIDNLMPTKFLINKHHYNIKHELYMTMIDTKMINSLTDTSSQKCYLCGAAPNEMNDIEKVSKKPIKDEYLKFGITSLHIWIRSFE
ncbi:unnamed protein product [Brassicogethes aeneus]|uniref:Uncharacterized protein n=1 Tax=Brassicogethes aeneus TaxID=1431903 RepID=A0A9P0B718_BRAAE|nr:unnamed protein product [Brassicogethes aeneus]